eukprot:TRINITY_DN976_c0_g1_i2.p1 TRINITY_DN976_c0_g1~~TRINITY_DN976_c0_g1_i2.p1  ORF type:complete len:603 (-),score=109.23 TRINITY_DN976_c0_g1_i2:19-1827(-)
MSSSEGYVAFAVDSPPTGFLNHGGAKKQNGFDWLMFVRLMSICKIIFKRNMRAIATVIAFTGLAIGQTYLNTYTPKVVGNFYNSIIESDKKLFFNVMYMSCGVILGSALLQSIIQFNVELLAWQWRKALCFYLHGKYFVKSLYYKVVSLDQRVDNPDQRITQDVDNFSTTLATTFSNCVTSPLLIVVYTYRCAAQIGWYAPLIVLGYFLLGYIINKFIMSPIVKLVFNQEQLEGNFRFDHVRVRTCAESIAIFDGGHAEKLVADKNFSDLLRNKMRILRWHFALNTSTNASTYFGSVLNYTVVALPILFIDSDITPTASYVVEASYNCLSLVQGFSQIINVSQSLSDLGGFTSRISELLETLRDLDDFDVKPVNDETAPAKVISGEDIVFEDVTCYTPTGIKLVDKLSFAIKKGMNLLIAGPTGAGKSSILRILNGLWPFFEGNITKPADSTMFYLPQKPYLFTGNIVEQVIYPISLEDVQESQIVEEVKTLLQEVQLSSLLKNYTLSQRVNWMDVLSPGQQQLVSFARLFYHRPQFAVLDEATSALNVEYEDLMYQKCADKYKITTISVGHRKSLRKFHEYLLRLDPQQKWLFSKISEGKK